MRGSGRGWQCKCGYMVGDFALNFVRLDVHVGVVVEHGRFNGCSAESGAGVSSFAGDSVTEGRQLAAILAIELNATQGRRGRILPVKLPAC